MHNLFPIHIPSGLNTIFLFFGVYIIIMGFYTLVKKDKYEGGVIENSIIEAFNLGEKARKKIKIVLGVLAILLGLFVFINSLLFINGTYWLFVASNS